jgi:hypothetical protein
MHASIFSCVLNTVSINRYWKVQTDDPLGNGTMKNKTQQSTIISVANIHKILYYNLIAL